MTSRNNMAARTTRSLPNTMPGSSLHSHGEAGRPVGLEVEDAGDGE